MKTGIHPEYIASRITCACGRVTETYATVEELHVEICSHCHPFFTGKQKLVDTAGRVERFRRKYRAEDGGEEAAPEAEAEAPAAEEPVAEADTPAAEAEVEADEAPAEPTEAED